MSFVNYIEFAVDLDQLRPSSFIPSEMTAIWSHIVTFEIGKTILKYFRSCGQMKSRCILFENDRGTEKWLNFLYELMPRRMPTVIEAPESHTDYWANFMQDLAYF